MSRGVCGCEGSTKGCQLALMKIHEETRKLEKVPTTTLTPHLYAHIDKDKIRRLGPGGGTVACGGGIDCPHGGGQSTPDHDSLHDASLFQLRPVTSRRQVSRESLYATLLLLSGSSALLLDLLPRKLSSFYSYISLSMVFVDNRYF